MKVCVLASGSFEKNYSSYHLMRDLILYLRDRGDEVSLIQKYFEKSGQLPPEFSGQGIRTHEIYFSQAEKSNMVKRMLVDIKYYLQTIKYIRAEKESDVFFLQSNNTPFIPIALIHLLTRKPVVYNVQDIFPQNAIIAGMLNERSLPAKVLLLLQKWSLKHADGIITISEDMKQTLISAGADPKKISVAYNWENEIHGEAIEKIDDGKFHVVYAGNIGVMQNVEIVVEAARLLKDNPAIQFDIYGNGARKAKCQEMAQGMTNVCFFDPVPADKAHSLYCNADVNVVPLAKGIIKTALPSKTAACLQCGKPTIFCMDMDSEWGKMLSKASYGACEADMPEKLANIILKLSNSASRQAVPKEVLKIFGRQTTLAAYYQALLRGL